MIWSSDSEARDTTDSAVCLTGFDWMQNSQGRPPCELASYVKNACDDNAQSSNLPPLSPNSSYPLPSTSNVCTCSWAYYNLISACSVCQAGEIPTWDDYQRACGSSTFAAVWSGAVSYFPPNVDLSDPSALPYWASINPSKWSNGRFDVDAARRMRNQGHEGPQSTGPPCSAGFEWMSNKRGQSPCEVAASVQATCSDANTPVVLPPISELQSYVPPINDTANDCSCSFVPYNLYSACTLCQHPSTPIPSFEFYSSQCGPYAPNANSRYYPEERSLPLVPYWAIANPFDSAIRGTFDITAALRTHGQGHQDIFQSATLPSSAPPLNTLVDTTIGALEIGTLVSVFLFGIVTKQTISYYNRYPLDPLKLKTLVAIIWSLELAHAIALSHGTYLATVELSLAPSGISVGFTFSGIIGAIVQAYFSLRIRILSGSRFFSLFLILLAAVRFVAWIVVGIVGSLPADSLTTPLTSAWRWMLTGLLVANALVDFGITVYFCVFYRTKQKDSFRSTVKLLGQLMQWTLQNGIITSVAGILTAIFFHTSYRTSLWVAIFAVLTRLFSNSFLASVNARSQLRTLASTYHGADSIHTTLFFAQPSDSPRLDLFNQTNLSTLPGRNSEGTL